MAAMSTLKCSGQTEVFRCQIWTLRSDYDVMYEFFKKKDGMKHQKLKIYSYRQIWQVKQHLCNL